MSDEFRGFTPIDSLNPVKLMVVLAVVVATLRSKSTKTTISSCNNVRSKPSRTGDDQIEIHELCLNFVLHIGSVGARVFVESVFDDQSVIAVRRRFHGEVLVRFDLFPVLRPGHLWQRRARGLTFQCTRTTFAHANVLRDRRLIGHI